MKIRLQLPTVNQAPDSRPTTGLHCGHWRLHRHGTVRKPIKDHRLTQVVATRYKCCGCRHTFRHYPTGVSAQDQSQHTVALAALCYGLGLSCSATAHLLGALEIDLSAMTVWRDSQALGAVVRPALRGPVRVLGADETVYRVKGREVLVGIVTDAQREQTLAWVVLEAQDGAAFLQCLAPLVRALGVEVLVSDEHRSYGVVAEALGVEQQLCLAHVRKAVTKRCRAILEQAGEAAWPEEEQTRLATELARIRELVHDLPAAGTVELAALHRGYLAASKPRQGTQASVAYRMRLLTLEVWEQWHKLRVHLQRPELRLDGTNNVTERAIGKSKVRYKTMRGYKSRTGMDNGIALTQWLYSGAERHDLAALMAA